MRRNVLGSGIFTLAAVGLFTLYRNRDKVREVLGRQGIRVPHREEIFDRIREVSNRVISRKQGAVEELRDRAQETLKEVG